MKIIQLYQDFGIDYKTEGHKHCRPGWVNVECPFCTGNPGYHLGFETNNEYFYCWRCGKHQLVPTISKLLNKSESKTKAIIQEYGGKTKIKRSTAILNKQAYKYPSNTGKLLTSHVNYLTGRNFDPELIAKVWKVEGTGPVSVLDGLDYRHRLVVPIEWNNEKVSFVARSIQKKNAYRYLVCPNGREIIHHKHILYGHQAKWKRIGLCVEGVTDVWRLGEYAFATFGIKFTRQQVREIAKNFDYVHIIFDNEDQANIEAERLMWELNFRGVLTNRIWLKGNDPGSMTQDDADYMVKHLMNRNYKLLNNNEL